MGNEHNSHGRSDGSLESAIEYLGERLIALSCDLVWDFTPPFVGLRWIRWRVARLDKEAEALRRVAAIHRSAEDERSSLSRRIAARSRELEAEYENVDMRLADLEERNREGSPEQRKILILIAYLLFGWGSTNLGLIAEVIEVQQAFSLAVSGQPR